VADETSVASAVELATELTIAWLGNPNTRATSDEVPAFLQRMHEAVRGLNCSATGGLAAEEAPDYTPATTVRRSLASKDHIISLIDGKAYKTLRRHLSGHGLTPAEYRARYKLKADYPMVAPSYSEARRSMAQKIGLGRKRAPQLSSPAAEKPTVTAPVRRGRKPTEELTAELSKKARAGQPPM
jgi:predicted transcriptional regulator